MVLNYTKSILLTIHRSFGVTSVHLFVFSWFFCGSSSLRLECRVAVCSWQLFIWRLGRIIDAQSRQMSILLALRDCLPRHQESCGRGFIFFFFAHYVTDGWRGRTLPDLTETRRESDTVPSCCWLIYSEQSGSERMDQDAARIISALKTWNCLLVLSVTWYSMCYYHKLQHLKLFFLPSLWTAWRLWLYSLVSFKASLF